MSAYTAWGTVAGGAGCVMPFHPQLPQRINQRQHTYHSSEVTEDEPTEAEEEEQAKVGDAVNLVATKIEIVRRSERHRQRPEEPSRRAKQRPPAKELHKTL